MNIDFPDEYLAACWDNVDWEQAEKKLADLQEKLTIAAFRKDDKQIEQLQKRIVRDTDIKCLAVRHVSKSGSSPGVDGVRWKTSAEHMRAAFSLDSKDYHASPLRQIIMVAKNTGKERRTALPTYRDRAMGVLYGYSLIPVCEAQAERKSFAFRPGRSTQDAHAYILEALKGNDSPELVVCADIKSYYATIHHSWLLANVPMDKRVLSEFLNAGIVFAGELFPADGVGISEGSNISPYLGNFVLDGLQKHIYRGLHGTEAPRDFADGNLIRFADDILVTVRTQEHGEAVLELLKEFLDERGLMLSPDKTHIVSVRDGFTFMSQTYIKRGEYIYSYPSDKAVERFIGNMQEFISTYKKSQRELIITINQKLKGWATYHRFSDAGDAFRKVDVAVQTALLESALQKHPKLAKAKVIAKYWYKESDGRSCYALPEDKSVRVIRLSDTLLLTHRKIKTNANPYVERDYIETRDRTREISNVTGPYRAIWERQNGRCHYCGRPILIDQPRTVVQLNLAAPPSVRNSAYIHKLCQPNEFELVRTMEDVGAMRPYDIMAVLEGIEKEQPVKGRTKKPITEKWKHYKIKQYFASCTAASVTLTFAQIEEIDHQKLPASARKNIGWWYRRSNCNTIAEAWLTEGYEMKNLDLKKEKVTLHRVEEGVSKLIIPPVLLSGKIPDNAKFELEKHMEYIIKKYGL